MLGYGNIVEAGSATVISFLF